MSKPEPAVGHVWRFVDPHGVCKTVEMVFGAPTHGAGSARALAEDPRWSCVGVETPHGRVMVGERRMSDCPSSTGPHVVARVINDIMVSMRDEGGTCLAFTAARVASWPIVAASTPDPIFEVAKRIAQTTPVDYDTAIRAVEAYGSEDAARAVIGRAAAGFPAPPPRALSRAAKDAHRVTFGGIQVPARIVAEPVYVGGQMVGKTRGRVEFLGEVDGMRLRPGTLPWVVAKVADLCGIPGADVDVVEDHKRAKVTARVPRSVPEWKARSAEALIRDEMPACIWLDIERFDPREQGPGIAALRPPQPPPSLPDVVYTWEAWALP